MVVGTHHCIGSGWGDNLGHDLLPKYKISHHVTGTNKTSSDLSAPADDNHVIKIWATQSAGYEGMTEEIGMKA